MVMYSVAGSRVIRNGMLLAGSQRLIQLQPAQNPVKTSNIIEQKPTQFSCISMPEKNLYNPIQCFATEPALITEMR